MSSSQLPVLIIGAGLGGLTLAQCLNNQVIPFRVFERDPATKSGGQRAQGWCISLHPWMLDDLKGSVRNDEAGLRAISPSAPLDLLSEGVTYSLPEGGKSMKELFRFGEGTSQEFIRVERSKLRQWLLEGVGQHVEWRKRFASYEEHGDRRITAKFEDGTSVEGSALVGADGVNSRVRRQLLQGADGIGTIEPVDLPLGIIIGEVTATKEQYLRWLNLAHSFSSAFAAGNRRLFVGLKSVSENFETAQFYWLFGWADEKASRTNYWTATATQAEMHAFVMESLDKQPVDPNYAEVFRMTPIEGIIHPPLRMRDMVPPELPRGLVTLLGDAIHCMVPFRGEGGNMAMKDAIVLGKTLPGTFRNGHIEDALKIYEKEMIERTSKSVVKSREATFLHSGIFK